MEWIGVEKAREKTVMAWSSRGRRIECSFGAEKLGSNLLNLWIKRLMNLLPLIYFGSNLRPILLKFVERISDPMDRCEPLPPLGRSTAN